MKKIILLLLLPFLGMTQNNSLEDKNGFNNTECNYKIDQRCEDFFS